MNTSSKPFAVDVYDRNDDGYHWDWYEFDTMLEVHRFIQDKKHWRFWVRSPAVDRWRFVEDERGPGQK